MKRKATAKEERTKEMLRKKRRTMGSEEQLDEEIEFLWKYSKPVMECLIALNNEVKRMNANINALVREAKYKERYLAKLHDKTISIETGVRRILYAAQCIMKTMVVMGEEAYHKKNRDIDELGNKVRRKKYKANAALSAATKKKDEIAELLTETIIMKNGLLELTQ